MTRKALKEELDQQLKRNKELLAKYRERGLDDTNVSVQILVHDIMRGEKAIGDDAIKHALMYLKGN